MSAISPTLRARRYVVDHLTALESEAIHIFREAAAVLERPALLFSGGKDSIVLLRIAEKAFRPARFPFPILHIDTGHNFPEALMFRDRRVAELGEELIVASVQESIDRGRVREEPGHDPSRNRLQTVTLLDAVVEHGFDALFGGGRRDEEKARAKERIFSHRDAFGQWDPRNQRPELWRLFNTRIKQGESMRVFPLSNWTEIDVWEYIRREGIPVVPLYLAKKRPVVQRDGALIMVDDDRMPLLPDEVPQMRLVRFRTLGCYPLTGAIESGADTLDAIIEEMRESRSSERQGRIIDHDESGSMEKKKREGYF